MKRYDENELYRTILEMVRIPSVTTAPGGEDTVSDYIVDSLMCEEYFKAHPENVRKVRMEGDPLGRSFVFAVVRAKAETARTVLLTGHMDVVDTAAYGPLAPWAFDPEKLPPRLADIPLPDDARADLDSGEWLFGRGVADMKGGLAAGLVLLKHLSRARDVEANVALFAVPDEENNSLGMLSASTYLAQQAGPQPSEGAAYVACVDLEPTFPGGPEAEPTIYLGTVGKINAFFYCRGSETHLGEYYEGFSASRVLSRINLILEGNPRYSDRIAGRIFVPYVAVRQTDLRDEYSSTPMTKGFSFYGHLTVAQMPSDVLSDMSEVAREALRQSIADHEKNTAAFVQGGGKPAHRVWRPTVLTYEEAVRRARERLGEAAFHTLLERTYGEAAGSDERAAAMRIVEAVSCACDFPRPFVVVGFLPPWYPHRLNRGRTAGERAMQAAAERLSETAASRFGRRVRISPVFEGVSDLSYCGFQGEPGEIRAFAENMPGWPATYSLPVEAQTTLDIPILNFGPVGKDAHKNTERIHLPYALEVYPHLLRALVETLADSGP